MMDGLDADEVKGLMPEVPFLILVIYDLVHHVKMTGFYLSILNR